MPNSLPRRLSRHDTAAVVDQKKSLILKEWEAQCLAEVPASHDQTEGALIDSLPVFLDHLVATLCAPNSKSEIESNVEIACFHGEERAALPSYTLGQVIAEYHILRSVLMKIIDDEGEMEPDCRHILHLFIDRGIQKASARFGELQNEEESADRNALEENRRILQEGYENLQKEKEFRERFVAALTHDLRTPLSSAKLVAQLVLRRANDPDAVKTLCQKVVQSMDRADSMIQDLLDANFIKAGQDVSLNRTSCRLDLILESTLHDLEYVYGPRFKVENRAGPLSGMWDRSAIQRILENLAGNAVKYGREKTPVTFTLAEKDASADISIHNEGNPIAPEDLEKLFAPYSRTKSAQSGTQKGWGIGLTLVKGLTEAHGGSVRVESSATDGTTFSILLPLSPKENS